MNEIFSTYDFPQDLMSQLTLHMKQSSKLTQFLMHFEHNLPPPAASRAITCAMTIAIGYFVGGFIPLIPYFMVKQDEVLLGLFWSVVIMAIALFIFGYTKVCFTSGWSGRRAVAHGLYGGIQMVLVGGVAAGAAMGLVRLFQVNSAAV
jgi:VIT1/CCC1 family predicted Fe2+/Mn2+ transporter